MEQNRILKELKDLPPQARRQVVDFIAFLKARYKSSPVQAPNATEWSNEPFVGIWKGREDMIDSVSWVRQIRQKEWRS